MTTTLFSGVRRYALPTLALLVASSLAACDLNVPDPNATTEEDAFTTRAGLQAASVGLQRQYAASAYSALVLTTGITTRELAADNTFANLLDLDAGGAGLATNNANVTGYFREMYQTISTAEDIIAGAATTLADEADLRDGLTATALFYKAAAIGALANGFTDVAVDTDSEAPAVYVSREDAYDVATDLLERAESLLEGETSGPQPPNLLNAVRAYRARYELFAGDLDAALAATDRVDPEALATFNYNGDVPNPLYRAISPDFGQPSFAVRDNLGLATVEDGDGRIAYFTAENDDTSVNGYPIETATGFIVGGDESQLPIFVPDEMNLIRAEVFARRGETDDAVDAINAVRTDDDDPFGLAAGLDDYDGATDQQSLLDEIYYNRATELYLQGLRLEDQRRLNQGDANPANAFSRSRTFYAFPQQERLANPDTTPTDPSI